MTNSMLIFDFDGVLMDSVREIAVTAYNTLTGDIVTRLNQVPPVALELFLRNRFHVQPIGDALILMKWCLEIGASGPDKLLSEKEYSVKNLRELDEHFNRHEKVVSLIFAEWGYTGPNDAHLARRLGYQSLTIEDFMDQSQSMF
jgi:hypothetical protein